MYEQEKWQILNCALEIKKNHLISLSGGNVSMRMPDGNFLVTPSGVLYDRMTPDDIVLMNENCEIIEGCLKPSSDAAALVYMFQNMPSVNAIIHTHQPYATAAGLITDVIPAFLVTLIDANRAAVNVAPFTPSSDIGMGKLAVQYAGNALAVILKHHGVLAYGKNLREALFSAVYLEEAAQTYMIARSVGKIPTLSAEDIRKEAAGWSSYGQEQKEE